MRLKSGHSYTDICWACRWIKLCASPLHSVGWQTIIFCFYFVHTKPPNLGANTCNSKSPIVSNQRHVWVHLYASCVSLSWKKLPSNTVSMPTVINVVYFVGHAGKLLVLGKKLLTEAAMVPRMGKWACPLPIPLSVERAADLHNAAKGSLNHYQETRRVAAAISWVGSKREWGAGHWDSALL